MNLSVDSKKTIIYNDVWNELSIVWQYVYFNRVANNSRSLDIGPTKLTHVQPKPNSVVRHNAQTLFFTRVTYVGPLFHSQKLVFIYMHILCIYINIVFF